MLMLDIQLLELKHLRYYYNKRLFTGVALCIDDGVITQFRHYIDGGYVGQYENPYFKPLTDTHIIASLLDVLDDNYYEFLYAKRNGEIFTGASYEFYDNGQCARIQTYDNLGFSQEVISFEIDGVPSSISGKSDTLSQSYN